MPAGSMTAVVQQPSKKGLRFAAGSDYASGVPATAGAGSENPMHVRRTAPDRRFFMSGRTIINGGRCGEAERLAGVLTGRILTPALSVASVVRNGSTVSNLS